MNMDTLYQKITKAQQDKRKLQRLQQEQKNLTIELDSLEQQQADYHAKLQEEKVDVEKLESVSLTNLFYTLIGQKEDKLDQEKQDVTKVQLQYQEVRESVADLKEDRHHVQSKISELGEPDLRYQQLLDERYQHLLDMGHETGQQALTILEKLGDMKDEQTEIAEAVDAGMKVREKLAETQEALSKAKNWGAADMIGGGAFTTAIKHGHIDDAKQASHDAQRLLRKFSYELNDIGQSFQADMNISGGLTFADYFLDGLIVDWFVQDKINQSAEQVDEMYGQVERTLTQLDELNREINQTIADADKQWEELVIHAH
ncbi:hypothetical protein [Gracilibacillus phocaeensis]|uniref:hypothetical protein n=1 Tax=Gracilibacillus phocaeensis TaxID=2042304 RepID=UPI00103038B6|nr:hypothetical protein [Gracilibacillus phocaeensis]